VPGECVEHPRPPKILEIESSHGSQSEPVSAVKISRSKPRAGVGIHGTPSLAGSAIKYPSSVSQPHNPQILLNLVKRENLVPGQETGKRSSSHQVKICCLRSSSFDQAISFLPTNLCF
jgi:hypothetical protein